MNPSTSRQVLIVFLLGFLDSHNVLEENQVTTTLISFVFSSGCLYLVEKLVGKVMEAAQSSERIKVLQNIGVHICQRPKSRVMNALLSYKEMVGGDDAIALLRNASPDPAYKISNDARPNLADFAAALISHLLSTSPFKLTSEHCFVLIETLFAKRYSSRKVSVCICDLFSVIVKKSLYDNTAVEDLQFMRKAAKLLIECSLVCEEQGLSSDMNEVLQVWQSLPGQKLYMLLFVLNDKPIDAGYCITQLAEGLNDESIAAMANAQLDFVKLAVLLIQHKAAVQSIQRVVAQVERLQPTLDTLAKKSMFTTLFDTCTVKNLGPASCPELRRLAYSYIDELLAEGEFTMPKPKRSDYKLNKPVCRDFPELLLFLSGSDNMCVLNCRSETHAASTMESIFSRSQAENVGLTLHVRRNSRQLILTKRLSAGFYEQRRLHHIKDTAKKLCKGLRMGSPPGLFPAGGSNNCFEDQTPSSSDDDVEDDESEEKDSDEGREEERREGEDGDDESEEEDGDEDRPLKRRRSMYVSKFS